MIIVNCNGEWVYFDEWQWAYWRDAFRVVISETGVMMRSKHEEATGINIGTARTWVHPAGQVRVVRPGI